jgi:hypothetical protein
VFLISFGYIITSILYFIIGTHMALKTDEEEQDTKEARE